MIPTSESNATDQVAAFTVGDLVLLHPWHILGDYDGNLYAKVSKCEGNSLFLRTRAVLGANPFPATALRLVLEPSHYPRKVTAVEVNGLQTGKNMFKSVMFEYANEYLHGQVIDYFNRPAMVVVETKSGRITISLSEVTEIPPPLAFLFYSQAWKTEEWSGERLLEAHQSVLQRLQGYDLAKPTEGLLEHAFQGIGSVPSEPISWVNSEDGNRALCRPFHAALFVRMEVDWQTAPPAFLSQLGNQWCDDPVFQSSPASQPVASTQPSGDQEPPPAHPVTTEVSQSPVVYVASSRPKRAAKDLFPQPLAQPPSSSELPVEDNLSFRGEEDEQVDWDEELSQASEAVIRCLEGDNARGTPKQSIRSLLGLTDASFQDSGRRAKKLHHPTAINNIMSRAFHSDACNRLDAQSYLESLVGARLPWNVHPYMSIRLRNAQFGLLGVRGFMFKKIEERERRAWALEHSEHLQDYGENCKVFDLPPLQTKQELVEAYGNLVYYFNRYGSALAKNFGTHLQWFVSNLQSSDMPTPASVVAHMDFIDSVLGNFARAVNCDVRNDTATHEAVHLELTKSNPELIKELDYLRDDRMRLLEASLLKKRNAATESGASANKSKKKKSDSTQTKPRPATPRDGSVLHLVAKHEGKQICLRHLSVAGCYSKDPAKCGSDERVHHVPNEPLAAAVVKHMVDKWGGISPKYPHLAA